MFYFPGFCRLKGRMPLCEKSLFMHQSFQFLMHRRCNARQMDLNRFRDINGDDEKLYGIKKGLICLCQTLFKSCSSHYVGNRIYVKQQGIKHLLYGSFGHNFWVLEEIMGCQLQINFQSYSCLRLVLVSVLLVVVIREEKYPF